MSCRKISLRMKSRLGRLFVIMTRVHPFQRRDAALSRQLTLRNQAQLPPIGHYDKQPSQRWRSSILVCERLFSLTSHFLERRGNETNIFV